jgi:ABC-type Fe3+/spermidine/putrescine transport system ATPase subunit
MPLLSLAGLCKRFGQTEAVIDVSLDVERGEFFGLLGPSGCGKTTTLRMIAGLEEPDSGTISFDEKEITRVAPERRGFGMVFQNYALFPHLNVFENVAFGLRARHKSKPEVAESVSSALELIQLSGYEKRRVDELSGGQQQRVAIARAIAIEPALLLFDEPCQILM